MCAQASQPQERKTVFLTIRVDQETHRLLVEQAEANERTISGEIRIAVRRYLQGAQAAA